MSEQAWSILKLRPSSPITFWPFMDLTIVSMVLTSTIPLPSVSNCWNVCQNNPINSNYKMWKNVTKPGRSHEKGSICLIDHWVFFLIYLNILSYLLTNFYLHARKSPKFCKNLVVANISSWTSQILSKFFLFNILNIDFISILSILKKIAWHKHWFTVMLESLCYQGWPTCPLGQNSP